MKLRNKKLLSLLLATAMVFTMNTSVFALEVGEDADEEYTVDFVDDSSDFEESEGAAEVDSVETDDFAFVDEIDGLEVDSVDGNTDALNDRGKKTVASMNALGWKITGDDDDLNGALNGDEYVAVKGSNLLVNANSKPVTIAGNIDSKPLSVEGWGEDELTIAQIEATENTAGSVTLTLLSANSSGIPKANNVKSGYWYIKGYPGDDEKKIQAWAESLVKDKDKVSVKADCSAISKSDGLSKAAYDETTAYGKITLTFAFSKDDAEKNNVKYGYQKKENVGGATVEYYDHIPFIGGKGAFSTKKTNLDSAFGMKISGNGVTYKIKSISVKFNKGSSTATITSVKLDKSVGTNKDRNAIQKALKKAITITCYPCNLSVAGAATKVKSKTSGKLMLKVKINGKTITARDGKSDKFGGTYKLTVSGSKIQVTGSKILCGEL